jgi:Glycosyl transferase family 2
MNVSPSVSEVPLVEIVLPVKNARRELAGQVTRLVDYLWAAFPCAWQITIADNGSTDGTWSVAQGLAETHPGRLRAVHLDRPGRGRALHTAWSASDADVVSYLDLDRSTDLKALLPLVAPLLAGQADVAVGTRLAPGAQLVRGSKGAAASRVRNLLLRATLRIGFSDAQCGFKALRADAARALLPLVEDRDWFFDTELLVLAERCGLRIHEVPVNWTDSAGSRVQNIATALADLHGIWRLRRGLSTGSVTVPALGGRAAPRDGAEGEFKLRGTVRAEHDTAVQRRYAATVAADLGWSPEVGRFHLFAVDIDQVTFVRCDPGGSGDQQVAMWPPGKEFTRRGTSATSVGDPEPVSGILRAS